MGAQAADVATLDEDLVLQGWQTVVLPAI